MPNYSTFFKHVAITDVQNWLNVFLSAGGHTPLGVDGVAGRKTWTAVRAYIDRLPDLPKNAVDAWSNERKAVVVMQAFLNDTLSTQLKLDGLYGPNTRYAVELWQDYVRDRPSTYDTEDSVWPSEAACEEFYGAIGKNHTSLKLPYPMEIAWDRSDIITKFTINRKCAASAGRVLARTLDHYGHERIKQMGLNVFSGCYNPRPKRGSSRGVWSMHAYACALDFDDTNNQWRWDKTQARMARPEYDAWWSFWEEEGWVSLGREVNYDWMHVQAATI